MATTITSTSPAPTTTTRASRTKYQRKKQEEEEVKGDGIIKKQEDERKKAKVLCVTNKTIRAHERKKKEEEKRARLAKRIPSKEEWKRQLKDARIGYDPEFKQMVDEFSPLFALYSVEEWKNPAHGRDDDSSSYWNEPVLDMQKVRLVLPLETRVRFWLRRGICTRRAASDWFDIHWDRSRVRSVNTGETLYVASGGHMIYLVHDMIHLCLDRFLWWFFYAMMISPKTLDKVEKWYPWLPSPDVWVTLLRDFRHLSYVVGDRDTRPMSETKEEYDRWERTTPRMTLLRIHDEKISGFSPQVNLLARLGLHEDVMATLNHHRADHRWPLLFGGEAGVKYNGEIRSSFLVVIMRSLLPGFEWRNRGNWWRMGRGLLKPRTVETKTVSEEETKIKIDFFYRVMDWCAAHMNPSALSMFDDGNIREVPRHHDHDDVGDDDNKTTRPRPSYIKSCIPFLFQTCPSIHDRYNHSHGPFSRYTDATYLVSVFLIAAPWEEVCRLVRSKRLILNTIHLYHLLYTRQDVEWGIRFPFVVHHMNQFEENTLGVPRVQDHSEFVLCTLVPRLHETLNREERTELHALHVRLGWWYHATLWNFREWTSTFGSALIHPSPALWTKPTWPVQWTYMEYVASCDVFGRADNWESIFDLHMFDHTTMEKKKKEKKEGGKTSTSFLSAMVVDQSVMDLAHERFFASLVNVPRYMLPHVGHWTALLKSMVKNLNTNAVRLLCTSPWFAEPRHRSLLNSEAIANLWIEMENEWTNEYQQREPFAVAIRSMLRTTTRTSSTTSTTSSSSSSSSSSTSSSSSSSASGSSFRSRMSTTYDKDEGKVSMKEMIAYFFGKLSPILSEIWKVAPITMTFPASSSSSSPSSSSSSSTSPSSTSMVVEDTKHDTKEEEDSSDVKRTSSEDTTTDRDNMDPEALSEMNKRKKETKDSLSFYIHMMNDPKNAGQIMDEMCDQLFSLDPMTDISWRSIHDEYRLQCWKETTTSSTIGNRVREVMEKEEAAEVTDWEVTLTRYNMTKVIRGAIRYTILYWLAMAQNHIHFQDIVNRPRRWLIRNRHAYLVDQIKASLEKELVHVRSLSEPIRKPIRYDSDRMFDSAADQKKAVDAHDKLQRCIHYLRFLYGPRFTFMSHDGHMLTTYFYQLGNVPYLIRDGDMDDVLFGEDSVKADTAALFPPTYGTLTIYHGDVAGVISGPRYTYLEYVPVRYVPVRRPRRGYAAYDAYYGQDYSDVDSD